MKQSECRILMDAFSTLVIIEECLEECLKKCLESNEM